ncbi:hypothetical protein [Virgisporangium aurantiacum]|nr:hypothetical protein [Virgisporangium aurantiacum]
MSVGTLGSQVNTDPERVDTQDPHLDDSSDQFRVQNTPLRRRHVVDVFGS